MPKQQFNSKNSTVQVSCPTTFPICVSVWTFTLQTRSLFLCLSLLTSRRTQKWGAKTESRAQETQKAHQPNAPTVSSVPDSNQWLPWLVGTKKPFWVRASSSTIRRIVSSGTRNAPSSNSRLHQVVQEGDYANFINEDSLNSCFHFFFFFF